MNILMTSIVDMKKSQHNRPHQLVKNLSKKHDITVLSINDRWKGGHEETCIPGVLALRDNTGRPVEAGSNVLAGTEAMIRCARSSLKGATGGRTRSEMGGRGRG
ncbi:MAG: hypothetical protein Q8M95_06105 [Candidatus Methanoperedens sp.]|nr:hypothetical protein [Candidatus Methanoperedens sp.]